MQSTLVLDLLLGKPKTDQFLSNASYTNDPLNKFLTRNEVVIITITQHHLIKSKIRFCDASHQVFYNGKSTQLLSHLEIMSNTFHRSTFPQNNSSSLPQQDFYPSFHRCNTLNTKVNIRMCSIQNVHHFSETNCKSSKY